MWIALPNPVTEDFLEEHPSDRSQLKTSERQDERIIHRHMQDGCRCRVHCPIVALQPTIDPAGVRNLASSIINLRPERFVFIASLTAFPKSSTFWEWLQDRRHLLVIGTSHTDNPRPPRLIVVATGQRDLQTVSPNFMDQPSTLMPSFQKQPSRSQAEASASYFASALSGHCLSESDVFFNLCTMTKESSQLILEKNLRLQASSERIRREREKKERAARREMEKAKDVEMKKAEVDSIRSYIDALTRQAQGKLTKVGFGSSSSLEMSKQHSSLSKKKMKNSK